MNTPRQDSSLELVVFDQALTEESSTDDISADQSNPQSKNNAEEDKQTQTPPPSPAVAMEANVPHLSYFKVFLLFLGYGFRAWGGPVAQIALLKQELVVQQKWISVERFNRVLAVYQVLPGPEATELCCYFGMLARGRIGSFLGGLGFILPGFCLFLLLSFLYDRYGLSNSTVMASFSSVKPVVCAMMFRAVHRIGEHVVYDPKTSQIHTGMFAILIWSSLLCVMNINFFIILFFAGLFAELNLRNYQRISILLAVLTLIAYILYSVFQSPPSDNFLVAGVSLGDDSDGGLFILGLLAGCLTFGGAYTAIPFVRQDAVIRGAWMTQNQFLDGLAIGNILPTPLVMFVTFVGYMGNQVSGAVVMTIGMFIPAFSFTIIGHDFFEKVVNSGKVACFLDGITAGVVGLVLISAWELLNEAVKDHLAAILFILALNVLYQFKHWATSTVLITISAIAGQVLDICYDTCPNTHMVVEGNSSARFVMTNS